MQIRIEPKRTAEWKRGLRGVTGSVYRCKHCNRDTNTIWQVHGSEQWHFTCSIECADQEWIADVEKFQKRIIKCELDLYREGFERET